VTRSARLSPASAKAPVRYVYAEEYGVFWRLTFAEWVLLCRNALDGSGYRLPVHRELKCVPRGFLKHHDGPGGRVSGYSAPPGVTYVRPIDWGPKDFESWLREHGIDLRPPPVERTKRIDVFHTAFEKRPRLIATLLIDCDVDAALERVYSGTQNVDSSWVKTRGQLGVVVTPSASVRRAGGCRSTSMGDYARVVDPVAGTSCWRCDWVGWTPITSREKLDLVGMAAICDARSATQPSD